MICPKVYDEFMGTVMDEVERKKLEFYIGNLLIKKPDNVPKYIVLYGSPGTGKSTILDLLADIFVEQFSSITNGLSDGDQFVLKIIKPRIVIVHDCNVNSIVKILEEQTGIPEYTRFIFATNELPDQVNLPITVLCMTGNRMSTAQYRDIHPCLKYLTYEYMCYCVDNLAYRGTNFYADNRLLYNEEDGMDSFIRILKD